MNHTPQFEIRRAKEGDFFGRMQCHLLSFAHERGEALMNALEISPQESESFSRFVCEKAISEGVSVLAWDRLNEKVAGFCINEPFSTIADFRHLPLPHKFFPLFDFLKQLDDVAGARVRVPSAKIFHLFNLGVLHEYRRFGIAKRLILESLEMAAQHGFEYAVAETTGVGSQTLCGRLGFNTLHAVPYAEYEFSGERPFAGIHEPKECRGVGIEI